MRPRNRIIATVFGLALCGSAIAAGGVYKWVDEDGVVHYGERPPEKQKAEQVKVQPPATAGERASARGAEEAEAAETEGRSEELERLLREEQCEKWTQALEEYRAADFLTKPTDDGGSRRLSVEESAEVIANAERMVAENCGDGGGG